MEHIIRYIEWLLTQHLCAQDRCALEFFLRHPVIIEKLCKQAVILQTGSPGFDPLQFSDYVRFDSYLEQIGCGLVSCHDGCPCWI